jgi:hypothetical protein
MLGAMGGGPRPPSAYAMLIAQLLPMFLRDQDAIAETGMSVETG